MLKKFSGIHVLQFFSYFPRISTRQQFLQTQKLIKEVALQSTIMRVLETDPEEFQRLLGEGKELYSPSWRGKKIASANGKHSTPAVDVTFLHLYFFRFLHSQKITIFLQIRA